MSDIKDERELRGLKFSDKKISTTLKCTSLLFRYSYVIVLDARSHLVQPDRIPREI